MQNEKARDDVVAGLFVSDGYANQCSERSVRTEARAVVILFRGVRTLS